MSWRIKKNVKLHTSCKLSQGRFCTPVSVREVTKSVALPTLLGKIFVTQRVPTVFRRYPCNETQWEEKDNVEHFLM